MGVLREYSEAIRKPGIGRWGRIGLAVDAALAILASPVGHDLVPARYRGMIYAAVAGLLFASIVLIWAGNAVEDRRSRTRITERWVRTHLRRTVGFRRFEARGAAAGALNELERNLGWDRAAALRFFRDKRTRQFLSDQYREAVLRRKADRPRCGPLFDPKGYCHYGPELHLAAPDRRPTVEQSIRNRLAMSDEAQGNRAQLGREPHRDESSPPSLLEIEFLDGGVAIDGRNQVAFEVNLAIRNSDVHRYVIEDLAVEIHRPDGRQSVQIARDPKQMALWQELGLIAGEWTTLTDPIGLIGGVQVDGREVLYRRVTVPYNLPPSTRAQLQVTDFVLVRISVVGAVDLKWEFTVGRWPQVEIESWPFAPRVVPPTAARP